MNVLGFVPVLYLVTIGWATNEKSEQSIRTAIESFLSEPLASGAKEHAATIVTYADESEDVEVVIDERACPWPKADQEYEHSALLLCAYIAGNARSQLDSGIAQNDPYSGVIQVFRVYRHLKSANKEYRVPEIEQLMDLHRKGKLMEHLSPEANPAE